MESLGAEEIGKKASVIGQVNFPRRVPVVSFASNHGMQSERQLLCQSRTTSMCVGGEDGNSTRAGWTGC